MPKRPKSHRPPGPRRKPGARPSAAARGYNSQWRKASRAYLDLHLFCVRCRAKGRWVRATVVDHVAPHKGDQSRFWDQGNWSALCKPCHDRKTAREDGGFGR